VLREYIPTPQKLFYPRFPKIILDFIAFNMKFPKMGLVRRNRYSDLRNLTYRRRKILEVDFPNVPSRYVRETLKQKVSLFAAYSALDTTESTYDTTKPAPYERLRKARNGTASYQQVDPAYLSGHHGPHLERELQAAREQRKKVEGMHLMQRNI
jgi:hypothetical protein